MQLPNEVPVKEDKSPFGSHPTDYFLWAILGIWFFILACTGCIALFGTGWGVLVAAIIGVVGSRLFLLWACR